MEILVFIFMIYTFVFVATSKQTAIILHYRWVQIDSGIIIILVLKSASNRLDTFRL